MTETMIKRVSPIAKRTALVAAAYMVGAIAGLQMAVDNPNVTSVWPPTGIAVAAVVLFGPRIWPGIAAGALLSNVINGAPLETALAISVGNTIAPLMAGALLRYMGFRPTLSRLKDVAVLMFVGGLGAMLVSATLGTISLSATGQIVPGHHVFSAWLTWWIGDALGVMILGPLIMVFGSRGAGTELVRDRPIEAAALLAVSLTMALLVFTTALPLRYLVFPLVLWAALRFHQRGAATLTVLMAGVALVQGTSSGSPFAGLSPTMRLLALHGFNVAVAITSLSLAAVSSERLRAQIALKKAADELEERVERRTAELRVSEQRMLEAQALSHVGSFHWNIAEDRVTWTDEMYRVFGQTPQEFPATFEGYLEIVHPDDRPRIKATIEKSVATSGSYDHEYRIVRPDGVMRWVHGRGEAVQDERTGVLVGLAGFCHDITQRKAVEDSLRSAYESEREVARRLLALDEMKDSLLTAVSHELRTPLTVIIGVADTLERRDIPLNTDDGRYLLSRLSANARRLHKLLMDLLDLDRLNRGVLEPRPRPTPLRDLALRILESLDMGDAHRVNLELNGAVLLADPSHVERILENLLINASKHTPAGTQIWVRAEPNGSGTVLVVEDAGPGVEPDLRSVIFEPFRQGDTPSHAPGTGIGLSLVARFAHLNGGRAWLEERPGGGASFRVLLPSAPVGELSPGEAAGAA
ncbi:MAG: MASE1 domain-containing protein [Actinomycetota bacterium]